MANETGVATSQGDFINKLTTFASNNGWTLDEFDDTTNNRAAVSRGNCFVQWRWDDSAGISGFQSLGFSGGTAPGSQADDSGNGDESGAIDSERRFAGIGNGPYVQHWFFDDDAIAPYVHYVLEYAPGFYVHGSFGTIEKFGTWTGGEYHGMSIWSSGVVRSANHQAFGCDSAHNVNSEAGTIHAESLPSEGGSSKWGVFVPVGTGTGTDKAGQARVRFMGGTRHGYLSAALQGIRANPSNGYVPMVPLHAWYRETTGSAIFLGKFIDVREMNGFFLNPKEEFSVGGDTWIAFPAFRKATSGTTSGNLFIAYRKVA